MVNFGRNKFADANLNRKAKNSTSSVQFAHESQEENQVSRNPTRGKPYDFLCKRERDHNSSHQVRGLLLSRRCSLNWHFEIRVLGRGRSTYFSSGACARARLLQTRDHQQAQGGATQHGYENDDCRSTKSRERLAPFLRRGMGCASARICSAKRCRPARLLRSLHA